MITSKQKQIAEIVRCGKDPSYFFNTYVKIQHPTRGTIPFKTYSFQDDCVQDFIDHRFTIVVKGRQLGLSTLVAAYSVWMALFHKDKNILIIATKLGVAQNFIKKSKTIIANLPEWMVLSPIVTNNRQLLELGNGSSIKAIPTSDDAGRSEALSLLIVDEAAFVRDFDTLWTGLYPTLSTGGRAIILSTPNGVGGSFR
jgi:phage FluMu gp28-like protein